MFHYSKYWGTWSRVLQHEGCNYIEVNLTPINGRYDNSTAQLWKSEVAPIIIRRHGTFIPYEEKYDKLPPMVVTAMMMNVGADLTRRLISDDLLSEIDLELLKHKMRGGGVSLEEVRKHADTSSQVR